MLVFSIGSVSSQSVNDLDDLGDDGKSLKNMGQKAGLGATDKAATNAKVTNEKNTKTSTEKKATTEKKNATKNTSKESENKKTNSTKKTTTKTTTVNKKTLAKTSTSFMNYVNKNGKFPKVKISNNNYSNTEYLYLISKAVENNSNSKIEIKSNLVKPYNNTNVKSVKGSLNKTEYVKIAGKTRKFIEKNQRAPNWVSSSKGNIPYNQLILSFSTCLDNYNKTGKLPNSIRLDYLDLNVIKGKINKSKSKKTTNSSAKTTSKNTSIKTTNSSAKTTSKNTSIKTTNSSAKTTTEKKNATSNKVETKTVEAPLENASVVEKSMDYVHSILNSILDRLDPSKFKIEMTKGDEANVKFNTSRVNVDVSGKSTVNVQISAKNTTSKSNTSKTTTKTTNAKKTTTKKTTAKKTTTKNSTAKKTATKKTAAKKNINASLKKVSASMKEAYSKAVLKTLKEYLSSSKNCQVNNKEIKALANKLTSAIKTDKEKGKKLFEWVRDNIGYDKYRNTRRGAVKTLQNRMGNCVDQSHLLVALSRASGIPARYVNGNNCRFTTGYVSGHVWTEMYIKDKWIVADTTSSRNSLGTIRNWNTKNFSLVGKYSSISF